MTLAHLLAAVCAYSWSWLLLVNADYNITIDDTNTTAIQYHPTSCATGVGEWQVETASGLYNGSIRFCNVQEATVTFEFTGAQFLDDVDLLFIDDILTLGVAVYFLSPLWPYQIGMLASLDALSADFINVTDPNATTVFNGDSTVSSHPVWSSTGLDNKPHVLVLSGANSMGGYHDLNVDGFV